MLTDMPNDQTKAQIMAEFGVKSAIPHRSGLRELCLVKLVQLPPIPAFKVLAQLAFARFGTMEPTRSNLHVEWAPI